MNRLPKDLVIVAAKRTPFGGYGGGLKSLSATDLGVEASRAALEDGGVEPTDIDAVIFGKYSGTDVKVDDIEYKIMRESDLLGKYLN